MASAIMQAALFGCHQTRIVEKGKALNFLYFQDSLCPHSYLMYGHEFWVMTESVQLHVQLYKTRVLEESKELHY